MPQSGKPNVTLDNAFENTLPVKARWIHKEGQRERKLFDLLFVC